MRVPSDVTETFRRAPLVGLVVLLASVRCAYYDASIVVQGNAGGAGPPTVFVTTGGWAIGGRGGATGGATNDAGSSREDANDAGDGADEDGARPPRPTAITITGETASPSASPSASGGAYGLTCPPDSAVIGYKGTVNNPDASVNYLRSFQAICGALSVTGSSTYAVETSAGNSLAQVGQTNGELVQNVMCPPNTVVVGFGAHSGSFIDSIAFTCAPLEITTEAESYTLSIGPSVSLPAIGGPRGMTLTDARCPAGSIAVGHAGKAGRDINSFGLLCGTPSLVVE
jgi:hypothetical protein